MITATLLFPHAYMITLTTNQPSGVGVHT
jgi:hypothetical protein